MYCNWNKVKNVQTIDIFHNRYNELQLNCDVSKAWIEKSNNIEWEFWTIKMKVNVWLKVYEKKKINKKFPKLEVQCSTLIEFIIAQYSHWKPPKSRKNDSVITIRSKTSEY